VCQNPPMPATAHATTAPLLAQLRISGADARTFLQGQLSNDMNLLKNDGFLRAGLHSPQGRVLALLQLCSPGADEVVALLPEEVAKLAAGALTRFVLRARVKIAVEPADSALRALPGAPASTLEGKISAIAQGIAQVYAATSGQFVAQMLNLDCLDAISFSKGCYTGQEVIARAHYRGRVKRRMQRFATSGPLPLEPGAALTLGDGRSALLVDSVRLADGSHEFLAVTGDADAIPPGEAADAPVTGSSSAAPATTAAPMIATRQLPLPYALP